MLLKDFKALWGIPTIHLKEYSKKYRLYSAILYLADVLAVFGITAYMFNKGISYRAYGFVLLFICILFHFIFNQLLNPEKWEAFRFYKSNEKCTIVRKSYAVDANNLYSILYIVGYKRLKQNKEVEDYKELILSACCENSKYSKSIMKYLQKYENPSGNVTCFIITKGKSPYFIDFDYSEESSLKEDNNDGSSNE